MTHTLTDHRPAIDVSRAEKAVGVLAEAFEEDPTMVYALPDLAERRRVLPKLQGLVS